MSEPKLISPMLDNFDMGGPISDHDGVRCCPAMRKNSDDKYIVKIISVPASQTKLDALLLTGACQDRNAALTYFLDQANRVIEEKKILDKLAQLEGFVAFDDSQIVPMDDGTGYDIYLLGEYRLTLERQCARTPMTQLSAVNLGLDLCAALSVCRRSGYMCVDLKPSNIYIVGDKEYKIGDLGFVRLNSLKYESLPDMYRSCYTAPEVEDAFAALNDTIDIYAIGLILYQVFNGGNLPFTGKTAPSEVFPAPVCADEEMATIILKACAPDPADRWKDPVEMGQALVNYMQKNGVNDTLLVPEDHASDGDAESEIEEAESEEFSLDTAAAALFIDEDVDFEVTGAEDNVEEDPVQAVADAVMAAIETQTDSDADEDAGDTSEETDSEFQESMFGKAADDTDAEAESDEDSKEDDDSDDEEYINLSFLDDMDEDVAQVLAELGNDYDGVTDELSEILGQVDALTAHQVPDPVVAPEAVEVKIPDPIVDEEPDLDSTITVPSEEPTIVVDAAIGVENPDSDDEEEIPEEELPYIPKKKRTGLILAIVLVLVMALTVGGYFFYTQYYLQTIQDIAVTGSEDVLYVQLISDIDESQLTIICSDPHGNKVPAPVVDGKAVFSGLAPDTAYTVSVEIEGFHKLDGITSKVYTTPVQTKILQTKAITGTESGSVILSFTVEGPDSDQWNVIYNTEGEAERITAFPSHMVTLAGLTVGKEYTFQLEPIDDIYISGETEITYVVKDLICAENLHAVACADGELTLQWNAPASVGITEWTVRCYNDAGYEETIITEDTTATFQNVDDTVANTVEITAADMSVSQRITVEANSVTISNFTVTTSENNELVLNWKSNRDVPAEGWTVRYTVDGVAAPAALTAKENSLTLPAVPVASYVFTIIDGAGNPVLGGPFTYKQPAFGVFDAFGVTQEDITVRLCKTPTASSWTYKDLKDEDYVNSFNTGDKISAVLALSGKAERKDDAVVTTFVIYDEAGNLISYSHQSQTWKSMWYQNYCELDIPDVPVESGTYKLVIYFNGEEAGTQKFEITN